MIFEFVNGKADWERTMNNELLKNDEKNRILLFLLFAQFFHNDNISYLIIQMGIVLIT